MLGNWHLEELPAIRMRTYTQPRLLVIDELGYLPLDRVPATVDRLLHNAAVLNVRGRSYRMRVHIRPSSPANDVLLWCPDRAEGLCTFRDHHSALVVIANSPQRRRLGASASRGPGAAPSQRAHHSPGTVGAAGYVRRPR